MPFDFVDTGKPVFVDDKSQARDLCDELLELPRVGFDSETTGLLIVKDEIVVWSLSDGKRRWCLSRPMLEPMEPLLVHPKIIKVGTNVKYDMHMFANCGIVIQGPMWDTLVMDWLYDENRLGRHGLKETVRDYNILPDMPGFQETFGPHYQKEYGKKVIPKKGGEIAKAMLAAPLYDLADYASLDAWASYNVAEHLSRELDDIMLDDDFSAWDHFIEVEAPFTRVLWNMERRGMAISTGYLEDIKEDMEGELERLLEEFTDEVGTVVNVRSPKQLVELFFECEEDDDGTVYWTDPFGDPPAVMTSGGSSGVKKPSLGEEVLKSWVDKDFRPAKLLMEHRKVTKIYGTYVKGLIEWADMDPNRRVHSTFVQTGTVTGRLSSRDPNMQNVPRPGKDVYFIRGAFWAEPGNVLYVADYEQLEMRLMAHFSGDKAMIRAIEEGKDLHSFTVSQMGMGATYEDVVAAKKAENPTPEQKKLLELRQGAKAVGFGLIYGIGAVHLGKQLGLPIKVIVSKGREREVCPAADKLISAYFDVFPGVKAFMQRTKARCRKAGYVQTLMCRFRNLPDINSSRRDLAAQAERQAVNSIIQGSAGDIAKMAMLACEANDELREMGVKMLLQVHDELAFEMPDDPDIRERAEEIIVDIMEHPLDEDITVPLPVGGKFAYTWGDAK